MLPPEVRALLARQDGVATRSQLVARGFDGAAIEVAVRRRLLTRVDRGTYVDHTGTPTWRQTVWSACLRFAPAVADPAARRQLDLDRRSRVLLVNSEGNLGEGE